MTLRPATPNRFVGGGTPRQRLHKGVRRSAAGDVGVFRRAHIDSKTTLFVRWPATPDASPTPRSWTYIRFARPDFPRACSLSDGFARTRSQRLGPMPQLAAATGPQQLHPGWAMGRSHRRIGRVRADVPRSPRAAPPLHGQIDHAEHDGHLSQTAQRLRGQTGWLCSRCSAPQPTARPGRMGASFYLHVHCVALAGPASWSRGPLQGTINGRRWRFHLGIGLRVRLVELRHVDADRGKVAQFGIDSISVGHGDADPGRCSLLSQRASGGHRETVTFVRTIVSHPQNVAASTRSVRGRRWDDPQQPQQPGRSPDDASPTHGPLHPEHGEVVEDDFSQRGR